MNFFIYSRKSVYTGKGESIENQIEMCRQYITSKFCKETINQITIYEDIGFSAKNTLRPHFQQMRKDMESKKPDYIICYRLDRISRNVSDFSTLIEELNNIGISFVCIKEEFDTSKPMGKAMMYIASVFAQLERETIAERVRDNMLLLARTGRWLGGTTPVGYTSEKIQEIIMDGKTRTSCKLKENPEELYEIDLIFQKFYELGSISGVSKFLIKQDIKSRSNRYYSLLGIKQILQNPVYCIADRDAFFYFKAHKADLCFEEKDCSDTFGLLTYNKRDYKKKHAPRQSMDKWIVSMGKHKGLITGEKWVFVQQIIESNIPTGKKPAKTHNSYSLLSGLIYCEKCGNRMFAKPRHSRGNSSFQFDYMCNSKLQGGTSLCNCQNINGHQADQIVWESLMESMKESSIIYKQLEKLRQNLQERERKNHFPTLEEKIKKHKEEIDHLITTLSEHNLDRSLIMHVNERIKNLDIEISQLMEKKNHLKQDFNHVQNKYKEEEKKLRECSNLKNCLDKLTTSDKRKFLKLVVTKIIWNEKDLDVYI